MGEMLNSKASSRIAYPVSGTNTTWATGCLAYQLHATLWLPAGARCSNPGQAVLVHVRQRDLLTVHRQGDRKSTRLNSSHGYISYAVFCLKKKKTQRYTT